MLYRCWKEDTLPMRIWTLYIWSLLILNQSSILANVLEESSSKWALYKQVTISPSALQDFASEKLTIDPDKLNCLCNFLSVTNALKLNLRKLSRPTLKIIHDYVTTFCWDISPSPKRKQITPFSYQVSRGT